MMKTNLEMMEKDEEEFFCQSAGLIIQTMFWFLTSLLCLKGQKLYQLTWNSLGSTATTELQKDMVRGVIREMVRMANINQDYGYDY